MLRRKSLSRAVGAALAVSVCAGMTVAAPPMARADTVGTLDTILGNAPLVGTYWKQIELWYGLAGQLITGSSPGNGQLAQIKALIQASQTQIIGQVDALATANVTSEVDLSIEQLANIDTMSPDALAAFVTQAVRGVTDAKADIAAETDPASIDRLGFDLNVIGPIALAASAKAGQPTDILTTYLIQANQTLLTKLAPTCGFTVYPGDNVQDDISNGGGPLPGDWPHIRVPGYGACVSYKAPAPAPVLNGPGDVKAFATGDHTGRLPSDVTGEGVPEITAYVALTGAFVNWPTPAPDYSIAIEQAMADTSYPIAEAALRRLQNPANTPAPGSSTAVVNLPAGQGGGTLAFAVGTDGALNYSNKWTNTFNAWAPFDNGHGANPGSLTSVAATVDNDGRIQLFVLDRTGQIYHSWTHGGIDWTPWSKLDGHLNSIAVASNADGALQIFGTDSTGAVMTRSQVMNADYAAAYAPNPAEPAADTWTGWETFSGAYLYKVVALTHSNGLIEVDGISPGLNGLMHMRQTAVNSVHPTAGWTPWLEAFYGQGSLTDIAVSSNNVGEFSFYGVIDDTARQNSEVTLDGYNTGGWYQLAGGSGIRNIAAHQIGNDNQLIGVKRDGTTVADTVIDGCIACDNGWSGPLTGAAVRATLGFAPVLTSVSASAGKVTLTFADQSPNEDQFEVYQVAPNSASETYVRDAGGLLTPNKTAVGEMVTFTDNTPPSNPAQQCYRVAAFDWLGSFTAVSDIMCSS